MILVNIFALAFVAMNAIIMFPFIVSINQNENNLSQRFLEWLGDFLDKRHKLERILTFIYYCGCVAVVIKVFVFIAELIYKFIQLLQKWGVLQ